MKIITDGERETARRAAEHIRRTIENKPDAVLALSTGWSMAALYECLAEMVARGEVSMSECRIFAVAEFVEAKSGQSCREWLEKELIGRTDIREENVFFPDAEWPEAYDALIREKGGLDLAVLAIGVNGRIAGNEPATPFGSGTHVQKLTDKTRKELGPGMDNIRRTVTMGIGTIIAARDIILFALGEERSDSIFKAVYGRTDSWIPAAFLQVPTQVTLYLDTGAASKL